MCKRHDLNIRDKPFAAFEALDAVFVNVNANQLHAVGKLSLGNVQLRACARNILARNIVCSVLCLVYKHIFPLFDI